MLLLNKSFIFCRYYAYLNTAVKYKMLKSMCMPSIVTWKSFFSSPHLQWLCAERAECIKKLFNSFLLIVFVNDEHWCLLFKMYFTRITHECLLDTEMQFWWKISIFFLFFLLYGVHQHSILSMLKLIEFHAIKMHSMSITKWKPKVFFLLSTNLFKTN